MERYGDWKRDRDFSGGYKRLKDGCQAGNVRCWPTLDRRFC